MPELSGVFPSLVRACDDTGELEAISAVRGSSSEQS